ncbi:ABC-F family ATP-binding cassette domain-containing protein [Kineococcus rhizosphaerae]|uniref:ABC-F family ATP-binding cassette domain-containing protein n=1 Tax=Kineococcus rhizosphaerae TaxID=559628 RepID=UPI000D07AE4C|nr:ABC-F family ATP-binding cassette domain-containing protein [Kineococcus rhizosphaerae]
MSATLVAKDLSAAHGTRALFSGLDLVVAPGDVVGLVGANGAGKSTLLKLLAGLDRPETGTVTLSPPTATVGYLPQEPDRRPGETVAQFLGRRTGVTAAQEEMDAAATALGEGAAGADDRYADALDRWLNLGGADLDERRDEALADVGFTPSPDALMTSLSGGQAARAGLAALLLSRYDVFLLDEPTNDLDLDGLARLERFVTELRSPAVVVSHDREFLTRTVDRVVELDLAQQVVRVVGGGYEAFLSERDVQRRHAREAYDEYAETKSGLEARARMQRGWMAQGVRNAVRKGDPDKNIRAKMREGSEKQAAKAKQTDRMIERLEVVEEPRKEWKLQMSIAAAPRSGSVVATLREAVVHRGSFTLGPVTLSIDAGDRVAVTGPNGAGKSTLLNLLLGRVTPDSGTVLGGSSVRVGEIDQARGAFGDDRTLARAFGDEVPDTPDAEVRTLLAKFGLGAHHVSRSAASLSPGERTRAALALLQARGVNLLVLDEPTNHLDLPAIEQLEEALASYDGTLLLVSHDRRLLEAVEVTRRLVVEDGRVREL